MGDRDYLPSGEELRRRREALGLSQRAFARKAGMSQPHVSNVERGTGMSHRMQLAFIAALEELEAAKP